MREQLTKLTKSISKFTKNNMNCPNCKKEIKTSQDLVDVNAEVASDYIEVKANCECGQGFYSSFGVDELVAEE